MASPSTQNRILDAAEELYLERGFADTSLRELTRRAGVNLSAVNYHFGSKEALFHALVERRFAPINERRLELLDALEAVGEPTLEEVLRALVEPIVDLRLGDPRSARFLVQIVNRLTGVTSGAVASVERVFRETSVRFLAAVQRALPGDAAGRLELHACWVSGAMLGTLLDPHAFLEPAEGADPEVHRRRVLDELVRFLAGALRAVAAEPRD
jgi:AcrR family transcriptional regulator